MEKMSFMDVIELQDLFFKMKGEKKLWENF